MREPNNGEWVVFTVILVLSLWGLHSLLATPEKTQAYEQYLSVKDENKSKVCADALALKADLESQGKSDLVQAVAVDDACSSHNLVYWIVGAIFSAAFLMILALGRLARASGIG